MANARPPPCASGVIGQPGVARPDAKIECVNRQAPQHRVVCENYAFGQARCAGSGSDAEERLRSSRLQCLSGARPREERIEIALQTDARDVELRDQVARGLFEQYRAGIVQRYGMTHFVRPPAVIDGRCDDAGLGTSEQRCQVLAAITQLNQQALARPNAEANQRMREPVDALIELAVGERARSFADCDAIRIARRRPCSPWATFHAIWASDTLFTPFGWSGGSCHARGRRWISVVLSISNTISLRWLST
jgi:hypothetical protein